MFEAIQVYEQEHLGKIPNNYVLMRISNYSLESNLYRDVVTPVSGQPVS